VDPVVSAPFEITKACKVATAGSCFAQHISRHLIRNGFKVLVEEPGVGEDSDAYGAFSAAYGNVYSTKQMLQLARRAYGAMEPYDRVWRGLNGGFVDPFRPRIRKQGFATADAVEDEREKHFAAVRRVLETCDVFVFTLGLTETWVSTVDGAAFPLAPGVAGIPEDASQYAFVNASVDDMVADLDTLISWLRIINLRARVILTVSPVPLAATFEPRHVLVSTTLSKSALRVCADTVSRRFDNVAYFPSYEIIMGQQSRGQWFDDDLRSVTEAGVSHVMSIFSRHFIPGTSERIPEDQHQLHAANAGVRQEVVCDEEVLDLPVLTASDGLQETRFTYRSIDEFLSARSLRRGVHSVRRGEAWFDFLIRPKPSDTLIFAFNGAVPPKSMRPVFSYTSTFTRSDATLVGVSDPSLYSSDEINIAWYAGSSATPVQQILPSLLHKIASCFSPKRVIMFGGSGGGFAALYYARTFSGAYVLVSNPQTSILRYAEWAASRYARAAWSIAAGEFLERLPTVADCDLVPFVDQYRDTRIIYLQNVNDRHHVTEHASVFLRQFGGVPDDLRAPADYRVAENVLLHMGDFGPDHSQASPKLVERIVEMLSSGESWERLNVAAAFGPTLSR
jgi:hypothetical protein